MEVQGWIQTWDHLNLVQFSPYGTHTENYSNYLLMLTVCSTCRSTYVFTYLSKRPLNIVVSLFWRHNAKQWCMFDVSGFDSIVSILVWWSLEEYIQYGCRCFFVQQAHWKSSRLKRDLYLRSFWAEILWWNRFRNTYWIFNNTVFQYFNLQSFSKCCLSTAGPSPTFEWIKLLLPEAFDSGITSVLLNFGAANIHCAGSESLPAEELPFGIWT